VAVLKHLTLWAVPVSRISVLMVENAFVQFLSKAKEGENAIGKRLSSVAGVVDF
jgi:hypothetical protein